MMIIVPKLSPEKYQEYLAKFEEVQPKLAAAGIKPTKEEYLKQLSPERRQQFKEVCTDDYANDEGMVDDEELHYQTLLRMLKLRVAMVVDGWLHPKHYR